MKSKLTIVFLLAITLLPQTAGAITVTNTGGSPGSTWSAGSSGSASSLSQSIRINLSPSYQNRWAIYPRFNGTAGRPINFGGALGGAATPPNSGGSLSGALGGGATPSNRPGNLGASLSTILLTNGTVSTQGRPENQGGSLGGGSLPSSRPDNSSGQLGGGKMPSNTGSSLASALAASGTTTTQRPNNTGSSISTIILTNGTASATTRPDNTQGQLGGGKVPSGRPDNTSGQLGGGKMPNNTGPSLSSLLGSSSGSGRPDNTGSSLGSGSSGSSTRPDNTAPSLADQLGNSQGSSTRPDNTGPSLADLLAAQDDDNDDDDNDNDNDDNDNDQYNKCNGRPYPRDIDGHWSEIYVRRLYDLCVVEGYLDGFFRPNANVTRAELVKMGLFANGIEPNRGCYDRDCGTTFVDLDEWQSQWIRPAWDRKVIQGYNLNEFRPNQAITRAEAVKVVLATYGYSPIPTTKSFFNDVNGWSTGWIEKAHQIGLVQGIGNGNFDPNRPITRAEAAKIVSKMIEYWDTNVSYDNQYRG